MDLSHFQHAFPLLFLLSLGSVALVLDLFLGKRFPAIAANIVQATLGFLILVGFWTFMKPEWTGFHGLFVDDYLTRVLSLFILGAGLACFGYSKWYVREDQIPTAEYHILGLFSILGMLILVSAHSFVTIYLGLELVSLPLYAMVALRRDDPICVEAALKYFIMGAIASALLLYGMSLVYGATGQLDLAAIATMLTTIDPQKQVLIHLALVFLVAGFAFKLAAVPFHMWAPDVYTGAPVCVTLFLATAPKLAAFGMAARLLVISFPDVLSAWQPVLIVIAILSMGLGNLLAMAQTNIKRLLAYSAIAHTGYMLLGLIAGSEEGDTAALFYIMNYALMSLAAFGMLTVFSRYNSEIDKLEDLRGLGTRNPGIAFMMLIIVLSMAGVPPAVGFFAKLFVLKALVGVGLVWLSALALAFAIWGAFYYIRIIKIMYFDEAPKGAMPWSCNREQAILLGINTFALLLLGLFPGLLLRPCQIALGA